VENDILFLDSSTTVSYLAKLLETSTFSNLTIITNSVTIIQDFYKFPSHYVRIGLGGSFDVHLNSFLGQATLRELEYLEVYGSKVTDLTPLASLKNLKHLNISRMEIDDITCLYDLDLERLRCVVTDVPKEQLEEYSRLHPDCQMLLDGYMPHKNGWRYEDSQETKKAPRYALLQEQMEYAIDAKYGIP
jgi:hypothetical protein